MMKKGKTKRFCCAISMCVAIHLMMTALVYVSGSQHPVVTITSDRGMYKQDDIVFQYMGKEAIRAGEIVSFFHTNPDDDGEQVMLFQRVTEVGESSLRTKDDNSSLVLEVPKDKILGRVYWSIPGGTRGWFDTYKTLPLYFLLFLPKMVSRWRRKFALTRH